MHDPQTLAHSIPRPWPERDQWSKHKRWRWPSILDIWHIDPETDGSDDSCGWAWAKLTPEDDAIIQEMADWDKKFPYYGSVAIRDLTVIMDPRYSFKSLPPGQVFGFIAGAWMEIKARKTRRRTLTTREISWIMDLACNPHDGLRTCLTDERPTEQVRRFVRIVMRQYLTCHRPWWRHPRWHVHHWKLVFPSWISLRSAFTYCKGCGNRLGYGYSPTSYGGERDPKTGKWHEHLYHNECVSTALLKSFRFHPGGTR
jgi:hypothetical protein